MKDPVLGHVENHGVHIGPFLKPGKIPLCGVYSLKYISSFVSSENSLRVNSVPLSIVLNEYIKLQWCQHGP